MRFSIAVATALILAPASAVRGQSAEPTLIADCSAPCPGIEIRARVSLGKPDDPILLTYFTDLTVLGAGGFAAAPTGDPGTIALFGPDGIYRNTLGRQGAGPGEFRRPSLFPGPADSVIIFDSGNGRITLLTPDGGLGRSFPFSALRLRRILPMSGGRLLVAAFVPDAGMSAGVLHVVGSEGEVLRSFGPEFERSKSAPTIALSRQNGRIFALPLNRYRIDEWTVDGEQRRTLERNAEWFEPWTAYVPPGHDDSTPVLTHAITDDAGRLWVFGTMPRDDAPEAPSRGQPPDPNLLDRQLDQVIEVIDPVAMRVVARQHVESGLYTPIGKGLAVAARGTEEGYVFYDIIELKVE